MNSKRLEEPHVSFSQINTYLGCPLRYRFIYIEQLAPEFVPSALPFGGGLHEAFAEFYKSLKQSQKLSHDDLIDLFKANWDLKNVSEPIRFDEGESKDSMLDTARNMLRVFCENLVQPGEPLAIEQEFTLRKVDNNGGKLLPLPLIGSIDLIERDSLGRIVCIDHKSSAKRYASNKANDDMQLSIYTAAIARSTLINGDKEFHARLDVLTKTKKPEFLQYQTTRNENDHRRVLKLIREVIAGIEAGIFFPLESWMCTNCQYQTACEDW